MSEQDKTISAAPEHNRPCGGCLGSGQPGSKCVSCPKSAACPGCDGCSIGIDEAGRSSVCGGGRAPRGKLFGTNWLEGISDASNYGIVEVQFKNTRKGFYRNSDHLDLHIGDIVAVDASPGHDIGQVTMTGRLVGLHMRKANIKPDSELRKVFRIARDNDLQKYEAARALEHETMIRSRKIAEELALDMKIGDVEYQGDGSKAIFYYIADERVDFRKLIRVLADTFRVRIEMKQIGARQEAGRIGGIGPCGRPLCCASWMTGFVSVGTAAARYQDLSMNPQKLAGQCAKLKCCLNFEADCYVDAARRLPPKDVPLETADATYYHFKTDILTGRMTYSTDKSMPVGCVTITAGRAARIIEINRQGEKVASLLPDGTDSRPHREFVELVGQDNINRFDKTRKKKKKKPQKEQSAAKTKPDTQAKAPDNAKGRKGSQKNDGRQQPNGRQQQQRKQASRPNGRKAAPGETNEQNTR